MVWGNAGPAYPALLILLLGYGAANTLYWNRHLLLSTGHATTPTVVSATTGFAKVSLVFYVIPHFGYIRVSSGCFRYFLISNLILGSLGLRAIRKAEETPPAGSN